MPHRRIAALELQARKLNSREVQTPLTSQPIAIDKDNSAENAAIINAGLAMALGKERFEALHLPLGQPVKIAHCSGLLAEPESRQRSEINGS